MRKDIRVLLIGGGGTLGSYIINQKIFKRLDSPKKRELNLLNTFSIRKFLKRKYNLIVNCAAIARMKECEKNPYKAIKVNIFGTTNLIKEIINYETNFKKKVRLIHISSDSVYPSIKGNYSENDPVKPFNNYGLSKLGGECAVSMYKNSLILRITMTEKPFLHKKAFSNLKSNFMFHEDLTEILPKILNKKGIINVWGPTKTIYNFAKHYNPKVKKIFVKKNSIYNYPLNPYMNLSKLKKIIK